MHTPKSFITALTGIVASALLCISASAHTISIGSFNAGAPGSVSLVMGTYDHGAGFAQGSITLIAGPGIPPTVTQNFTTLLLAKPSGLVDGVNNFYGDVGTNWGTGVSDSYNSAINNLGLGAVVNWQSATFTGLTAGIYTYQLSGMDSVNWTNINSFANNWTGTLIIPDSSINGVPDAGVTVSMLGLGLVAVGFFGRRKANKVTS